MPAHESDFDVDNVGNHYLRRYYCDQIQILSSKGDACVFHTKKRESTKPSVILFFQCRLMHFLC